MQPNKTAILSTRPLQAELIESAAAKGFHIDGIPFIETEPIDGNDKGLKEIITTLLREQINVVFTSMNAVDAVAGFTDGYRPDWKIFCIGAATKKLVQENFGDESVAGTAASALALADEIIAAGIPSVVFFCGDLRRDELPDKLNQHQVRVNEIMVYKTRALHHRITKNYDGIAFFSPSAVHSFFAVNQPGSKTILFAIGDTTGDTIKTYSNNTLVISAHTAKDLLIREAIAYFEKNTIHH